MAIESRDTPERYGWVSRALHWGMAALFAWQFFGVALDKLAEHSALAEFFGGTHSRVGFLLFVLVAVRLVWALVNRAHRPSHGTGLLGMAARVGHGALYALMVVVPALAILRSYGSGRGLNWLGVQLIPATGVRVEGLMDPARALHGPLAWTLLVLIAGHVAMAIFHDAVLRDRTIAKMAG